MWWFPQRYLERSKSRPRTNQPKLEPIINVDDISRLARLQRQVLAILGRRPRAQMPSLIEDHILACTPLEPDLNIVDLNSELRKENPAHQKARLCG